MRCSRLDKLRKLREELNIHIKGQDKLKEKNTHLFISNHNRLMDIFYLPIGVDMPMISMISSRLIYKKIPDRQKMIEEHLYAMPVETHGGKKYSDLCLKNGTSLLVSGLNVGIFPEGAYMPGKTVYRGRTGASRMLYLAKSMGLDVELVPVAIDTKENTDLDSYELNNRRVTIQVLDPIEYGNSYDNFLNATNYQEKNKYLHQPIDNCMIRIAKALHRPYCNEYIDLTPKDSVMFPDNDISIQEAQKEENISLYRNYLEDRAKVLQKEIRVIQKDKEGFDR